MIGILMTKTFVDELVANMKKAGIVTKAAPWMVEGIGEKQMNVRYVGIKPFGDWVEIIPGENNLLLKFVMSKNESYFDLLLANKPPFVWVTKKRFTTSDKWEVLLGDIKRRLAKDKEEFIHHQDKVGNLYVSFYKHLK